MIKTNEEIKKLELEKKIVNQDGIYIEKNPLTNDWFIFGKHVDNNSDCSIYGTLSDMKKCAKIASKIKKLTQKNYYTQV